MNWRQLIIEILENPVHLDDPVMVKDTEYGHNPNQAYIVGLHLTLDSANYGRMVLQRGCEPVDPAIVEDLQNKGWL